MKKIIFLIPFLALTLLTFAQGPPTTINPRTMLRAPEGPDSLLYSTASGKWTFKAASEVDNQSLSVSGSGISISNGNTVSVVSGDANNQVEQRSDGLYVAPGAVPVEQAFIVTSASGGTLTVPGLPASPQNLKVYRSGLGPLNEGSGNDWTRSTNIFTFTESLDGEFIRITWEQ